MVVQLDEHPTVKEFWRKAATMPPAPVNSAPLNADWLRRLCFDAGADDVGFVERNRAEIADQRGDIDAVFRRTKTLEVSEGHTGTAGFRLTADSQNLASLSAQRNQSCVGRAATQNSRSRLAQIAAGVRALLPLVTRGVADCVCAFETQRDLNKGEQKCNF